MNKIIKDQISNLKPSATLAINEESNKLRKKGKKIFKFGFGQSPFPIPDSIILSLKNSANLLTSGWLSGESGFTNGIYNSSSKVERKNQSFTLI